MLKGDISGSGSLEQIGSGVTVLAGNNSYGGGTTLQSGTLVVGLGDSGGIAGNIVNNASLAFNRADKYSFSGAISGQAQSGRSARVQPFSAATAAIRARPAFMMAGWRSTARSRPHRWSPSMEAANLGNGNVSTTHIDGARLRPAIPSER
ncbi:hypothetical protein HED52_19090 [Ochrobactrum ciceri]|uniref:Outer membrane autotransporter n=1 Tax=Brucella ciceri TaxID=391287 RepID=A0ABX1DZC3_9HYPH|nr:hypothetical protein [Brucella ciceri]